MRVSVTTSDIVAETAMSNDHHKAATAPRASGRPTLSREQIITAAIRFVDEHGLSSLSMRRLGKELGVEAMSLYRYVNGREDLLEGIIDRMVAQVQLQPNEEQLGPADGWQAYLQWLAHGVRSLAREHPNVFPLIATQHPAAPWLRPPLRSLDVVEDFLAMLISRGFSDVHAVLAYRAFSSFLLGHLLLEASLLGAKTSPPKNRWTKEAPTYPTPTRRSISTDSPTSTGSKARCPDHAAAEFEQGLEDVLDRLDRFVAE